MILKKGSKGAEVKQLQAALGLIADGDFGTKTEQAVKEFQIRNGLYPDGVVGEKTLAVLTATTLDTDLTNKAFPEIQIIDHLLPPAEYLHDKIYQNEYIILHHTAGWDNPIQVIDGWATDSLGRVATEFVVGGQRCSDGRDIYDGQILRAFPEGCQGGHIGKSGSSFMNLHSVGIEMCNFGGIKDGKTYTGAACLPSQRYSLTTPFRGYKEFHRYSDAQLQSTKKLLQYISQRDNIDLHQGLYQWIQLEGEKAFDFHQEAYDGKVKGLLTHGNIRKDKVDCPPQPELIDMIMSL